MKGNFFGFGGSNPLAPIEVEAKKKNPLAADAFGFSKIAHYGNSGYRIPNMDGNPRVRRDLATWQTRRLAQVRLYCRADQPARMAFLRTQPFFPRPISEGKRL